MAIATISQASGSLGKRVTLAPLSPNRGFVEVSGVLIGVHASLIRGRISAFVLLDHGGGNLETYFLDRYGFRLTHLAS